MGSDRNLRAGGHVCLRSLPRLRACFKLVSSLSHQQVRGWGARPGEMRSVVGCRGLALTANPQPLSLATQSAQAHPQEPQPPGPAVTPSVKVWALGMTPGKEDARISPGPAVQLEWPFILFFLNFQTTQATVVCPEGLGRGEKCSPGPFLQNGESQNGGEGRIQGVPGLGEKEGGASSTLRV